jgi:hypothetical protein
MRLDYWRLQQVRKEDEAWRLLCADHAALVMAFLHRAFVVPNARELGQGHLIQELEMELIHIQEKEPGLYAHRSAGEYLDDWSSTAKGWLRKFYPQGSEEAHFDLTPAAEKAILFAEGLLSERRFVGTASRLMLLFEMLQQIHDGRQSDPQERLAALHRQQEALEVQIAQVKSGQWVVMSDTDLRERYFEFQRLARELSSDFREVEKNFRTLDRQIREKITLWSGSKGELLDEVLEGQAAIEESDQHRSFQAFWALLSSPERLNEFSLLLEEMLLLEPIQELKPELGSDQLPYEWLEAGDHALRTSAHLSAQLRRFLDDKAWLDQRRLMEILREVEEHAIEVREAPPRGDFMELEGWKVDVQLPLDRPLYRPSTPVEIKDVPQAADLSGLDTSALFSQVQVDTRRLRENITQALRHNLQVSLGELISQHPLEHGLAELVAYLHLAHQGSHRVEAEAPEEVIVWRSREGAFRQTRIPRTLLLRTS